MTETLIHCPECGTTIPISEALQPVAALELESNLLEHEDVSS